MNDENITFNEEKMTDEQTQFDTPSEQETNGGAAAKKGRKPAWTEMAGSAGAGVFLGIAAATLTGATVPDGEPAQPIDDAQPDAAAQPAWSDGEVAIATGVNDDMSFSEAFAAARQEVGPGGAFEWHGGVYGTYTAEEWNSMSPAEQAAYGDHFTWNQGSHTASTASESPAGETAGTVTVEQAETQEAANGSSMASTVEQQGGDSGESADVEVLGVVHDEETGASYVGMTVEGHDAFLVDVDGDQNIDYLCVDVNDDHQLSEGEVVDVSGEGLTIGQFEDAAAPADQHYASNDLPDYTNDANVDDFVQA